MYINYNELIKLVINLNEMSKNNSINEVFNYLNKSKYLNNILSNIEISKDNNTYKINFLGKYIGNISSDMQFDTSNNRTKYDMLKYVLYKNSNLIVDILYSLININNYLLEKDNYARIEVKRKIFSVNNEFESIDNNIWKTNGKIYYYIYNNSNLIGIFNYIGNYYTCDDKIVKMDDSVKINSKEFVLNNMKHYNNTYFNSIVLGNKSASNSNCRIIK